MIGCQSRLTFTVWPLELTLISVPRIYKTYLTPFHPWLLSSFLFRAFKGSLGCQESKERGAPGWVSSRSAHLLMGPIFSIFSIITSQPTSEVWRTYCSPTTPCFRYMSMITARSYRGTTTEHSVTFLDYGAFSQALVCFGSRFDQALRLHCQVPFVNLEGKQA